MSFPKCFNISRKDGLPNRKKDFRGKINSEVNYSNDAKFHGNILVVGRTSFGKTTLLGINEMTKFKKK